jgi:hypothetical protein
MLGTLTIDDTFCVGFGSFSKPSRRYRDEVRKHFKRNLQVLCFDRSKLSTDKTDEDVTALRYLLDRQRQHYNHRLTIKTGEEVVTLTAKFYKFTRHNTNGKLRILFAYKRTKKRLLDSDED